MTALLAAMWLQAPTGLPADPRLDRPVDASLSLRPLPQALALLSRGTGVELKVANHMREWKVDAFGAGVPLRRWLEGFADVHAASWEPATGGYRLVQSPAQRKAEEERSEFELRSRARAFGVALDFAKRWGGASDEAVQAEMGRRRQARADAQAELLGYLLTPTGRLWARAVTSVQDIEAPLRREAQEASYGRLQTDVSLDWKLGANVSVGVEDPLLFAVAEDEDGLTLRLLLARQGQFVRFDVVPVGPPRAEEAARPPVPPWPAGEPLPDLPPSAEPEPEGLATRPIVSDWPRRLYARFGAPVVAAGGHWRVPAPTGATLGAWAESTPEVELRYRDGLLRVRAAEHARARWNEPRADLVDAFEALPPGLDAVAALAASLRQDTWQGWAQENRAYRLPIGNLARAMPGFLLWHELSADERKRLRLGERLAGHRLSPLAKNRLRIAAIIGLVRDPKRLGRSASAWAEVFDPSGGDTLRLWASGVSDGEIALNVGISADAHVVHWLSLPQASDD